LGPARAPLIVELVEWEIRHATSVRRGSGVPWDRLSRRLRVRWNPDGDSWKPHSRSAGGAPPRCCGSGYHARGWPWIPVSLELSPASESPGVDPHRDNHNSRAPGDSGRLDPVP